MGCFHLYAIEIDLYFCDDILNTRLFLVIEQHINSNVMQHCPVICCLFYYYCLRGKWRARFSKETWVGFYVTLWNNLSNHAVESLKLTEVRWRALTPAPPPRKPLLPQSPPLLDRSAYHLNLPTMLTACFHGSKPISYNSNLVVGNLFILVLFNLKIKIIILILFYWFICGLKRYSVPLYYMSWCEESLIKWEDVTEN